MAVPVVMEVPSVIMTAAAGLAVVPVVAMMVGPTVRVAMMVVVTTSMHVHAPTCG